MFQVKECKKYLFPWVKSLLFKAKTLNFVEVLSGFKRDHVVCTYTVDRTGSRVLCLKIMDGVTFGSLICSNISFFSIREILPCKKQGPSPQRKVWPLSVEAWSSTAWWPRCLPGTGLLFSAPCSVSTTPPCRRHGLPAGSCHHTQRPAEWNKWQ